MEPKNTWTQPMIDKAIEMYNAGKSCYEIAKAVGRTEGATAVKLSALRKDGKVGRRNSDPIDELVHPEQTAQKQAEPEQSIEKEEHQEIPDIVLEILGKAIREKAEEAQKLREDLHRLDDEQAELGNYIQSLLGKEKPAQR